MSSSPPEPLAPTHTDALSLLQPDGYLTEERKAADPDHGFSTFFSETGMRLSTRCAPRSMISDAFNITQARENTSREPSTAILSPMLSMRFEPVPTGVCSTPNT